MRIRTIKPEFWTDSFMVSIAPIGRLVFLSLFNVADDYGCFTDDLEEISMLVFPKEDPVDIADWIDLFLAANRIELLEGDDGEVFYRLVNWERHQRVDRPSKSRFLANSREDYRKRAIPLEVRRLVAQKYKCPPGERIDASCFYCGEKGAIHWHSLYGKGRPSAWVTFGGLELEHLEAEYLGGEAVAENMVLSCRRCNRSKGVKPWYEQLTSRTLANPREPSCLEGKGTGKGKEQGTRESGGGLFDSFWKVYPRKIGKGEAEKSFKKAIKEVTLEAMIEAVRAQSNSDQWKKDGGQFIPSPSTWLNQKRWNDELELSLSPILPDGPPDWLPENWKEIAVKMLGSKAELYTSHTDIPPDWRFSFKQFCTGERQFDEEEDAE